MKKLTANQLRTFSRNLDYFFNNATDEEIAQGKRWYKNANEICEDISNIYRVPTTIAAGVISALSPRNKWDKNIKDAYSVFAAINEGLQPEEIKVSTFHTNKFKAFEIAKGNKSITWDSQKTFSFVRNVGELDENFVTVDVWHLRACFKKLIPSQAIGRIAYDQIVKLTSKKALKLGLKPYEYQAIVWVSCRNNLTR